MRKRLAFLLVLLIVFLLSGCSTIPLEKQKLEEYKYVAIQELNIYLETKLANNFYDDAGHNNLVSIVENSIAEIQNAEKNTAIDLIKSEAQRDMDFVGTMKIEGEVRGAGVNFHEKKTSVFVGIVDCFSAFRLFNYSIRKAKA